MSTKAFKTSSAFICTSSEINHLTATPAVLPGANCAILLSGRASRGRECDIEEMAGLMIRHLVMPNDMGGSAEVREWIAENLPKDTYTNLMAQYTPYHKAFDFPEISRRITGEEYRRVVDHARDLGLSNLDIQGYGWLRR